MSTPRPRGHRPRGNGSSQTNTPTGDTTSLTFQRLPSHSKYPLTPNRFASTPSGNRSASRYTHTPRNRGGATPSTPHGLRAMQRRAANTPGRDRRRSGRVQRETTFDVLRNLGRALAPTSKPIRSSPREMEEDSDRYSPEIGKEDGTERDEIDELDNEPEMERPRLSLPLQDVEEVSEEGSPDIPPPRLSLAFDEEDITQTSVEFPLRAISERDRARLSMMSGPRPSENFGDLTRLEFESDRGDETGVVGDDGEGEETVMSQGAFDRGGETEDLGRFNFEFDFPSPNAQGGDAVDEPLHDDEGFELPQMDLQQDIQAGTGPVLGHDAVESDHNPPRVSPSEASGVVGGGLRDEDAGVPGRKQKKLSRHGIPVPNLPSGVVRKLATRFARTKAGSKPKINKATLAAIEQASSWFFEQASEDLEAYSRHAGRKTIDESDVTTLMRRQRQISSSTTAFSLAQKHLPKELLQEMRLAMPP